MKKLLLLLAIFFLFRACSQAQTPPPWMTVTAANIHGGSNALLPAGSLIFAPVDSTGAPISFQAGGGGQLVSAPTKCAIANGAIVGQCLLANVSASNPSNFCYSGTITDSNNKVILGGHTSGYQCVQPQTTNFWCAAGSCNFDQYVPNLPAAVTALMPPPTTLSLGGVYAASCTLGLVQTGIGADGRPVCGSAIGTGNVVGTGLTAGVPVVGGGGSNVSIDAAHLVALTGADINTSNQVVGLAGKPLPALSAGYLNYDGASLLLTNPFASPTFTGIVTISGLASGCLVNTAGAITSTGADCGGTGSGFQVNSNPLGSLTTINFLNSAVFNGLTFTFTNPSVGNIQIGASGTLSNAGLQNSAATVNGQTCALGSTCTLPFQTNGAGNISQAGENRVTSTANAIGLTATPVNSASNQAKIEIGGTLGNAGLQNPATTVNGQTCTLGAVCNVAFQTNGANNASLAGLNVVNSTANAVGLTVTASNASNQERLEVAGALTNAGLANPSTNVNGSTCTLGATCTPPATGITSTGPNGSFWGVSGGVQGWLTPAGAGNVNGPGAATVGHFAFMNNSSGTLLSDGGAPGPLATQPTGGLATGIAKVTTGTGLLSAAVAGDFPPLNQSTTGNAATATQLSTTGVNGTFWGVSGGGQGYFTPPGGGNVSGSGLTNLTPLVGAGGTNIQIDVGGLITVNAGNNALTGTNTFSALTTFSGSASFPAVAGGVNQASRQVAFTANDPVSGANTATLNELAIGDVLQTNSVFASPAAPYAQGLHAGLAVPSLNAGEFGPRAGNNRAYVDGHTYTSLQQALETAEGFATGNNGVRGKEVVFPPAIQTTWVIPPNLAPDLLPMAGIVHQTTCVHSDPVGTCHLWAKPLILGSTATVEGAGIITSGSGDMTGGTLMKADDVNWFPPVGVPSSPGTANCTAGGTTYDIAKRLVVNLQGHATNAAFGGPGAYALVHKTACAASPGNTFSGDAPAGTATGSLAAPEYEIGFQDASGDFWAMSATDLGCTAGALAVENSVAYSCLVASSWSITQAAVNAALGQTFPFEEDRDSNLPVDLSNPFIVTGVPGVSVSFGEQFKKISLACHTSGHGVNNPNVLWWNFNGQEGWGTNNGPVSVYGDCGCYAGTAGAYIYSAAQTPNGTLAQLQMSGGPTNTPTCAVPFKGVIFDGRGNGTGGAAGSPRAVVNVTVALKGTATASSAMVPILVQGKGARTALHDVHLETTNSQDAIIVTQGANVALFGVEGTSNGNLVHITSTAGEVMGMNICTRGLLGATDPRCDYTKLAIKNDKTGGKDVFGQADSYTSGANFAQVLQLFPMAFATLSSLQPCAAGTEGLNAAVTDDNTAVAFNATITGSGTHHVKAYCDGTNWVMQ